MSDLSTTIMAAIRQASPDTYSDIQPHTSWLVSNLLEFLRPSDLSSVETMAMAIILSLAHARKLASEPGPLVEIDGDSARAERLNFLREKGWLPAVPSPELTIVAEAREDIAS